MNTGTLDVRITDTDGCLYVVLEGELDPSTAPRLEALEDQAFRREVKTVNMDLTELRYVDSTGLMHLVRLYRHLRNNGGTLTVEVRKGSLIQRVLRLIGGGDLFPLVVHTGDTAKPDLTPR